MRMGLHDLGKLHIFEFNFCEETKTNIFLLCSFLTTNASLEDHGLTFLLRGGGKDGVCVYMKNFIHSDMTVYST